MNLDTLEKPSEENKKTEARGVRFIDLTGKRFDRLFVKHFYKSINKRIHYTCICECGSEIHVSAGALKSGNTKSCGCLNREVHLAKFTKHGHALKNGESNTYYIWQSMCRRCHSPNDKNYSYYGERGISVCQEWRESFEVFLSEMGECPSGLTIERNNNSLGYSLSNCHWATRLEQSNNRRGNVLITTSSATLTMAQFSREIGCAYAKLRSAVNRGNRSIHGVTFSVSKRK